MFHSITFKMYLKRLGQLIIIIMAVLYVITFTLEVNQKLRIQRLDRQDFENISETTIPRLTEATPFKPSTSSQNSVKYNQTRGPILNCAKNEIRSGYCVVSNVIRAKKVVGYDNSVTLTTQGTAGFLIHIREVCKRWQGPISLAVYSPGSDFELAGSEIRYLKNCGLDQCVSDWVTWHVIYDVNHQPNGTDDDWLASDCREPIVFTNSYVTRLNLTYPINVARNVARLNAKTKYVSALDIELYPSLNIIPEFLKMVKKREILSFNQGERIKREVYVFPIFEVNSKIKSPPVSKRQLYDLYKSGMAVSFHRYVCENCHRIPYLDEWLSDKIDSDGDLDVFKTTKRNRALKLESWEPFFVGINDFPLFDETLPWNGKYDQMQVALEMCFLDFDFHILDRAFLVHAPGIKVYNASSEIRRHPFILQNTKRFHEIKLKLKTMYKQSDKMCL